MDRSSTTCRTVCSSAVILFCLFGPPAAGQEPEPLFHARLSDGTQLTAEPVRDWHDINATPRIGNAPLFDAKRPAEWLIREGDFSRIAVPNSFVEFVGGDRLPGEVVGYSTGDETPYRRLPPHLIVRPTSAFRRPNTEFDPPVRICADYVRRVVWHGGAANLQTNMAVLREGRRVSFRAARWTKEGVSLLLDNGLQNFSFGELAAIRLSGGNDWQAYFDHAATVLPSGEGRLIQIETTDGLIALTSKERLRPEAHGDNRRSDHWYQVIEPAWSLDPLWLRFPDIAVWRFFSPEHVPLTMIDPTVTRRDVTFSSARPPQRNRSSADRPLFDDKTPAGWGFGTHAPCELAFPLPDNVAAFRGAIAMDPAVGTGGCAKAFVELRSVDARQSGPTKRLFESELLIGTSPAKATGRLSIDPAQSVSSQRELVLISDPAYDQRPAGADPFDIRDAINWIAPTIELDRDFVRDELRRRAMSRLPGLAGWKVDPLTATSARVTTRWDTRDWEEPRFRSVAAVETAYVAMERELSIGNDHRYLAVYVHAPHDDYRPARVQVRLDSQVIGEQPVPTEHGRREPDPLLFPVDGHTGTVTAEIIQLPGAIGESKPAAVDWRGADLVSHRPGLVQLFDDENAFADLLVDGDGSASIEPSDAISGEVSLRVNPPGRSNGAVSGWDYVITEEPDLGEYRFLRFAWKAGGKGPIALSLAHSGQFGPGDGRAEPPRQLRRRPRRNDDRGMKNGYRYVAGPDVPNDSEFAPAIKLDGSSPQDWRVIQRDLYGDFGTFALTGVGLHSRDGYAGLDGIYLARSADQFRFLEEDVAGLPQPIADAGNLRTATPAAYHTLVRQVMPSFGLSGQGGELSLLAEYRGRQRVLRTLPEGRDEKQSARLTTALVVPEKSRTRLKFSVSHHTEGEDKHKDWDLQVLANGREILGQRIDHAAMDDGWLDLSVDLAEFAGQPVRLELRHKATDWDDEFAYWHDVRIEMD